MFHPYWTILRSGESAKLALRITNHSPRDRTFRATIHTPEGFGCSRVNPVRIAARAEGLLEMAVQVPRNSRTGLCVVTADVGWEDAELRVRSHGAQPAGSLVLLKAKPVAGLISYTRVGGAE